MGPAWVPGGKPREPVKIKLIKVKDVQEDLFLKTMGQTDN
jgi:hypothetical protein